MSSPSTALTLCAHSFTVHEMCRYFSSVTNFFLFPTIEHLFKPLGVSFSYATSKAWWSTNREKLSIVRAGGSAEAAPALPYLLLKMWWGRSILTHTLVKFWVYVIFFFPGLFITHWTDTLPKAFLEEKKMCLYVYIIHKVNKIVSLLL